MSTPLEETPGFNPAEHPDDGPGQIPEDPDFSGDPVEADEDGLDALLPSVSDDSPITGD